MGPDCVAEVVEAEVCTVHLCEPGRPASTETWIWVACALGALLIIVTAIAAVAIAKRAPALRGPAVQDGGK